MAPVLSQEFLDIQTTIEYRLTMKRVRDMIIKDSRFGVFINEQISYLLVFLLLTWNK